jgi:integrase
VANSLPIRPYVKVWVKKRKNNPRKGGQVRRNNPGASATPTVSLTLEWVEYGQRRFLSLGPHATAVYARRMAAEKEMQLNSEKPSEALDPVTWDAFRRKYFATYYPGHDRPPDERREAQAKWGKSFATMRSQRLALDNFERIVKPDWCHTVTSADREKFVAGRLAEVPSAASVDADLRVLRSVFNVLEEWKHRPEGSNPFAGRGKATVGSRRRRQKDAGKEAKARHYTFEEVQAILRRATAEARKEPTIIKKRLRALVYFVAYTGCRINEAVHLEWTDIDWDRGVAWLFFKVENDLKTEGSQAPFGLSDRLLQVLKEWETDRTSSWVFPNAEGRPWKTGGPGYRPLDQLKSLAGRAGVEGANWKRFRHALSTLGKGRFGLTAEQVRAQLRHTTVATQEHYTHDDLASLRDVARKLDFE